MNTGLICVEKHSFFEDHNHPLIFAPPLSCQASPPFFWNISNPPIKDQIPLPAQIFS